ncbi:hypothetical protein AGABI2DRAFT_117393 [Agaricus bisporus var. bisporus H97]|uniref:hypothetical protein n=1 Tax=Agaricus bisporus var. bisporus (strain H97 / ATCC MYA-4626 / FGSC 10389) TaxID=936046 RepID=UPI00029F7CB7|nr:hypothetical protein AGABI2DRAFT_117393 [Agaricus bisporus var. bisporus H97]EKV48584.1 hypothetical protein AGABI2DRAFT_117393 [Agaricus bisporus var. bisporus H97]
MASHGPQRTRSLRVAPGHLSNQGTVGQTIHPRESSPSPALRERSRPLAAPAVPHMYASQALAQQIPPHASPTGSSHSRTSPPTNNPLSRHLPTPPQASTSPNEVGVNPSLSQILPNHANHGAQYSRAQVAKLTRYQNSDHDFHITPELLDAIERADQEQAQTQTGSPAFANYPRNDSATPPDLGQDRIRTAERTSPSLDPRRRDALPTRESPTVRQPHSPSSFAQSQVSLSERLTSSSSARSSPLDGGSSGETYTAYMTRDSPPVQTRRRPVTVASVNNEPRGQYGLPNQTPPLQSRPTVVRSLPVHEEDDPRVGKDDPYHGVEQLGISSHRTSSPISSSDVLPEGNKQHFEKPHSVLARQDRYTNEEDDDGATTPRSPSVGLPDKHVRTASLNARIAARISGRTGPMEQLGLRGIEETIHQSTPNVTQASQNSYRGGQHPIQRKLSVDPNHQYQQAQYYADESSPYSGLYHGGQYPPDEYYAYGDPSSYYFPEAHYTERPRPDAPIPPTPHSQTTAPSPASFAHMYQRNARNYVAPSPIPHAGSPYPAPFEHVRRNVNVSRNTHPQVYDPHDPNFDLNVVREQMAGQWQKFAQNTHMAMSDSTFSPSTTPFQGNFAPWAHLHARRTLGRAIDLRSMQSSPALERVERHDRPPSAVFRSKKKQLASRLSTEIKAVPPRVQSTQPRDTSPEPSTSGEETAGEDRYETHTPNGNGWVHDDGDSEWVDEDEESDEDDLLELEYHPSYVKNISKRRKRWENGWERLVEAFEALDRQTDATMVLLAAPSHSTKLHTVRSRCIRRQAGQPNAPDMTPLKVGFKRMATHRRKTRSHPQASLAEKILESSPAPGESSDGSEVGWKRAFETAVNSLSAFESIFAEREARISEEMRKASEDRERMDLVLRQIFGSNYSLSDMATPEAPLL